MNSFSKFTILITTKNRLKDLTFTLLKIEKYLIDNNYNCIICDDGSIDNTSNYIKKNYPKIKLIRNETSKGLIYSRNKLLSMVSTDYAISIDDDAHFITKEVFEPIHTYFEENKKCAVVSFRIFWGIKEPNNNVNYEKPTRVKGFVGCGHAWRMKAWQSIPQYPSWFIFYGEEDFAAYQLFKNNWEVHYLPTILVHHRADVRARKKDNDYYVRIRRSLRSGWYLMLLFYPKGIIPKMFLYTLWVQIKNKLLKGDIMSLFQIFRALLDVLFNLKKIRMHKNRLSEKEYLEFKKLKDTKIYWKSKEI